MGKHITISAGKFIAGTPLAVRPKLVRMVYSNAASKGWDIRVAGQHWDEGQYPAPLRVTRALPEMSPIEWDVLMGHKPG